MKRRTFSWARQDQDLDLGMIKSGSKLNSVQNQVDEVIDVMQENITKVIERGERLDELQDKSDSLSDNASAFSSRAKQLRRQMWWRGCKMKAIMALVVIILLLVIIIPLVLKYRT
ncbi:vesicle-associated membrane protein 4 isoform X4 [Tachyglossus aculeatus]|uniref:vesicle-associated membrane protein 4 isoform X4 n=1 Tax=Tachyglossus aculeatus TaxID=9261 RepID=UPI0018F34E6E|nr:vesicle-associated membrane protein 4 isoform X4 [Tachyglossus aculeatus]